MARLSGDEINLQIHAIPEKKLNKRERDFKFLVLALLRERAEIERDGWRRGMEAACRATCEGCAEKDRLLETDWHIDGISGKKFRCAATKIRKLMEDK